MGHFSPETAQISPILSQSTSRVEKLNTIKYLEGLPIFNFDVKSLENPLAKKTN